MVLGPLFALFVLKYGFRRTQIPPEFIEQSLLILLLNNVFEQSGHEAYHVRFLNKARMAYVKYLKHLVQLFLVELILGPKAIEGLFHK